MENTYRNLEQEESSAIWVSDKGPCSEAPCEAARQSPVEQMEGETPDWGSTFSPVVILRRNLRV